MAEENPKVEGAVENGPVELGSTQLDDGTIQELMVKSHIDSRTRRKKLLLFGGIALAVVLGGFGLYRWLGSSKDTGFLTVVANKGAVTDAIQATGTLAPVKKSDMGFKNDAAIIAINVKPGDRVQAGQVLAQQDATTLEAALRSAQSQLSQDQISVENQTIVLEANARNLAQQEELYNAGAVTRTALQQAQDTYRKSELDLKSAQARLVNDQAKVDQARSDLDGATLMAPFDGIIGAVNGQVGQLIGINASSNVLLSVMSEDLQLSALVNEADIGRIKLDQDVEFTTSAYGDKIFKGKVGSITPEAKTVSNVQYYPVVITCIDPNHQLRSGMSASAKIILARKSDVLTVPIMAVNYAQSYSKSSQSASTGNIPSSGSANTRNSQRNLSASTGSPGSEVPSTDREANRSEGKPGQVLVLENNQAVVKKVMLGLSDGQNYEVISGLNEGERIIIGTGQSGTSTSTQTGSGSSNQQNRNNNQRSGGNMVRIMP